MPGLTLAGIMELEPPPTPSHFPSAQTQGVINPLTQITFILFLQSWQMHVAIRLLPLICTCLWVLNSIPQENGSKFNEKIFYHHYFYKTSAFLENMLIFMCWHEKKPPSNMKRFNVVKLFGFVPRKYFWVLYTEFSRAFPFRSNGIDTGMIAGLLCSANICCVVCWRQRGGNHSWTVSVGEPSCCSSHFRCTAIYSVSELALGSCSCCQQTWDPSKQELFPQWALLKQPHCWTNAFIKHSPVRLLLNTAHSVLKTQAIIMTPHSAFTFFKHFAVSQIVPIHFWPCSSATS